MDAMSDREMLLGVPESGWMWCRECERAYPCGSYKEKVLRVPEEIPVELRTAFFQVGINPYDSDGEILQMCPYSDCDGDTFFDAFPWEWLRSYHPEYPEVPVMDCVYPLR